MKVYDIVTKRKKNVVARNLVFSRERSLDYIISIPHGGSLVPVEFKGKFPEDFKFGWDPLTQELYKFNRGTTILSNLCPSFLNVNRAEIKELPLYSKFDKKILMEDYTKKDKKRVMSYYHRYHLLLESAIKKVKRNNGFALLFDCHSLSPVAPKKAPDYKKNRADFIVGTLDDTSADRRIIDIFISQLKRECKDYSIKKNYPYKGGFITAKYSDPKNGVHVIQIEVNRRVYLDNRKELRSKKEIKKINSMLYRVINSTFSKAKYL